MAEIPDRQRFRAAAARARFGMRAKQRHIGTSPLDPIVEDAAGRLKSERRDIRKISTRPPDLVPVPGELWKK